MVPTIFSVLRIDEGDILIEFRRHVEQSIMLVIDHAMGPDAVAEIDMAGNFARGQIDDQHFVAIESRMADADIAIDGNVGGAAVGRGCGFMTVHDGDAFGDGRDLLFAGSIDQADVFISLVDHNEKRRGLGVYWHG